MKVVGLCGGSGSGKGTVAKILLSYGIPSIDTDAVYHEITSKKTPCTDALAEEFGSEILNADGSLNRRSLAKMVFCGEGSAEKRKALNRIAHKFVLDRTREILRDYEKAGVPAAIVDAPLLFESGFYRECDVILSVVAEKDVRISRIISRDGISENDARLRIESQLPDEYLSEHSDFVISNSGSIEDLSPTIRKIAEELKKI